MTNQTEPVAGERLKSFIERIERVEEEKAGLLSDIRDIFAEAKATGFDVKIIRQILKLRKMEKQAREEQEELLACYMDMIGEV